MERIEYTEGRPGWETTIRHQGLVYGKDEDKPGYHYWNERAAYEISSAEKDHLKHTTEEVFYMCLQAADHMSTGAMGDLNLPAQAFALAKKSWDSHEMDFYGRFDFVPETETSDLKVLEFNADTPTGLVETAICQEGWFLDKFSGGSKNPYGYTSWNHIGEAFTNRWAFIRDHLTGSGKCLTNTLHVAHVTDDVDPTGEDKANAWMIAHAARQAGWDTQLMVIDDLYWDEDRGSWMDAGSDTEIESIFKLYPWEDMVLDDAAQDLFDHYDEANWFEPAWKMFLSTKMLLPTLWKLFPGNDHLLKAYPGSEGPGDIANWVRKPLFGREGDGITIHAPDFGVEVKDTESYFKDAENSEFVYQQYTQIPLFAGDRHKLNHPIIGSWTCAGESVGVGMRETDGPVTDYWARFVPLVVTER